MSAVPAVSSQPIGWFVHHQGRGHAERAAAAANALIDLRPVTLFCARGDIFPALDERIELVLIPSLFEPPADPVPPALAAHRTPETLHCAPLGWPTITEAVAILTAWFAEARPALFVADVSAELGQLARIASVPHAAVMQHGDRDDPGHMAAYQSASLLIAPYAEALEQPDRPDWMRAKTLYAPGIGADAAMPTRADARARLGLSDELDIVAVVGGGGGTGLPSAPLALGARAEPETEWITLGRIEEDWHATPPGNLKHLGWVDNPADWIAAADRIVSSCGNTTVQMIARSPKPWVVVPEWRYFHEQLRKAEALERAGAAVMEPHWPARMQDWRAAWTAARSLDPATLGALVADDPARALADAIDAAAAKLWAMPTDQAEPSEIVA